MEAPYISGFTTFSPTALGWQTSAQPAHGDRWLALGTREGIEVRHLHQACHAHPTSWLPGALMEGECMRTGWVHDHCRCACQINTIDPCQEGATDAVLARFTGEVAGGPLSLAALPNNALVSGGAHDGTLTFFKVEGAAIRQSVILAALMCVLACSCGRCRKSARFTHQYSLAVMPAACLYIMSLRLARVLRERVSGLDLDRAAQTAVRGLASVPGLAQTLRHA